MDKDVLPRSLRFGGGLGAIIGALIGTGSGAITATLNGVLIGLVSGLVLGLLTGLLTSALAVKTAGTTGGVSVGAYTGMGLGAVIGAVIGALIPESVRMSANTQNLPVLDALVASRFETAVLISFLLAVLGTAVGGWVAGRNLAPGKSDRSSTTDKASLKGRHNGRDG